MKEGDNIPYIPPEQLSRIKQVDLLTYLKQNEPEELVKLSPSTYCTRSHDSLKISNGMWCQWSTGIGGRSALDYLIKIRGMSLPDAALAIDGTVERPSFSYAREPPRKTEFHLPERSDSNDRIIKYLLERGIDRNIIIDLIESGRIYEERDHHNVVFVGVDTSGTPRHAAIRASNNSRFMIDAEGSEKEYSFSLESSTGCYKGWQEISSEPAKQVGETWFMFAQFTLTKEDAKRYLYQSSTKRRVHNWDDITVRLFI